jgi:hypothetical protein
MKRNIICSGALLFGVALFFISKKEMNMVLPNDLLASNINNVRRSGHLIQTKEFPSEVAKK